MIDYFQVEKSQRSELIEEESTAILEQYYEEERELLLDSRKEDLIRILRGKVTENDISDSKKKVAIKKGTKLKKDLLKNLTFTQLSKIKTKNHDKIQSDIEKILKEYNNKLNLLKNVFEDKYAQITTGDDLPLGVIKMVKVYIAMKRKLSVGDKMAGRHGNKGVLAKILPIEDMPFMDDGSPIEIILNPLGVPSRMNVGQILEAHLGWACKKLGEKLNHLLESLNTKEFDKLYKRIGLPTSKFDGIKS